MKGFCLKCQPQVSHLIFFCHLFLFPAQPIIHHLSIVALRLFVLILCSPVLMNRWFSNLKKKKLLFFSLPRAVRRHRQLLPHRLPLQPHQQLLALL